MLFFQNVLVGEVVDIFGAIETLMSVEIVSTL